MNKKQMLMPDNGVSQETLFIRLVIFMEEGAFL